MQAVAGAQKPRILTAPPRPAAGCASRTARLAKLIRVKPKLPPLTPSALPVREALQRSAPLAHLQALMRESNGRFAAIVPQLPRPLASHVRPGPVDDAGWSLLAANAAVAAKLRQLEPRLHDALKDAGWPARPIRIKVQVPGA